MSDFWDFAIDGVPIPLWLVVLLVMLCAMLLSNVWWFYRYLIMRPVAGHGIAARAGNEKTQQVLMFGMNRAFSIQALEYMEKVLSFKDPTRVARWLQTSPYSVGMLGYKSIMLVSEIFDHPKDPVAEMAIVKACSDHNSMVDDTNSMITDYNSYRRNRDILEQENLYGVPIAIYSEYDPGVIHPYVPNNRTSGQFGGTVLKDAGDLNMAQPVKTAWEKAIPVFICLVFGIIAIALTYMYATSGAGASAAATLPNTSIIPGV